MPIQTTLFGYPKIGLRRELKVAVESFWDSKITEAELYREAEKLNLQRLERLVASKLDYIPVNDFSLYDFILDLSTMFGVVPKRFNNSGDGFARYSAMARGHGDAVACEMTKWFDTNYHYIVPELSGDFTLEKNRPLDSYRWAKHTLGVETKPVLVGPFTYVYLGKIYKTDPGSGLPEIIKASESGRFREFTLNLSRMYNRMLKELEAEGVRAVQLDEPALVYDVSDKQVNILLEAYRVVTEGLSSIDVYVHTYYESLSAYERIVKELPVNGIGLDFVVDDANYRNITKYGFPRDKKLVAGILDGRSPWKTDIKKTVDLARELATLTGGDTLILSNAAPLFHLPVSLEPEKGHIDDTILDMLSFADERLAEMKLIKEILNEGKEIPEQDLQGLSNRFKNEAVRKAVAAIKKETVKRPHPFAERFRKQQSLLGLPKFPTTTIGSFPQTDDVRKKRAEMNSGKISKNEYENFIENKIQDVVRLQEEIGLDVLVHGEFERTDMVEFFGQKMQGFTFTKNGWVQSYGTRCVRPPIIYGDVSRPGPMTVKEAVFAQSLTKKPVKGMLTGPVTILNWSFYRKDIPKKEIAFQIALALKDEVTDLEKSGITIIQIDEPALREGLPLKKSKQKDYLEWAIKAYRATNAQVKETTQIQAHMCYSEFNEIIEYIHAMDSDVILIEGSKNRGDILQAFENFRYDHGIGIGVYDVHSPRVPGQDEIRIIIDRALRMIDKKLFWINPDCGLKTRGNEEVISSLRNMVAVARSLR